MNRSKINDQFKVFKNVPYTNKKIYECQKT